MPMTIHIDRTALESLTLHAARASPEECCGVLLGRAGRATAHVRTIIPADNITAGDRTRTYQLDWNTLLDTMRLVRETTQQLVGFYHSHPDGSIEPSERDRRDAWLHHSYLIIGMKSGRRTAISSWRASDENAPFTREQVALT